MRPFNRWLAAGVLLAGSISSVNAATSEITAQQLFAGHSEGNGTLTMLFGKPKPFHVESHGQMQSDGTFRLEQTVTFKGETPKARHWILETVAQQTYAGTLSDAAGKVTGKTEGNRLILRYRLKGPLFMHQTLILLPDRSTIDNVGRVSLLGIPIGRLHETIIRENPLAQDAFDQ